MTDRGVAHTAKQTAMPMSRYLMTLCAGCRPSIAAENIAHGYRDAGTVIAGWTDSPGHRRNLLLGKARQAGAARAEGGGRVYWVMVFAAGC